MSLPPTRPPPCRVLTTARAARASSPRAFPLTIPHRCRSSVRSSSANFGVARLPSSSANKTFSVIIASLRFLLSFSFIFFFQRLSHSGARNGHVQTTLPSLLVSVFEAPRAAVHRISGLISFPINKRTFSSTESEGKFCRLLTLPHLGLRYLRHLSS